MIMAIRIIRQIDRACRSREDSALPKGLKVAELCASVLESVPCGARNGRFW